MRRRLFHKVYLTIIVSLVMVVVVSGAGHDTRALQAWLGHKNIQHTVRYTELSPERFRDFWKD